MDGWDNAKIENHLPQKKTFGNSTNSERHLLVESWRYSYRIARKSWLQSWKTDIPRKRYQVRQTFNARPLTVVSDHPEDLTSLPPSHFLPEQEKTCAPFMPSSERYHDLIKSFQTARASCNMIWKRLTLGCLPQWN